MIDQAPATVAAPAAAQLPQDLQNLIDAAAADGDDQLIGRLFGYIEKVRPDLAALVAFQRAAHQEKMRERQAVAAASARQKLMEAGPLDNWSGQVEFGASWSTGPAESLGAVGSLDLKREGVVWTHRLLLRGEVQDTNGIRAVERIVTSWQPRHTLAAQSYLFGLAQYERDPALGYTSRYSAALGAGWAVPTGKRLRLAVEGGPALRRAVVAGSAVTKLAGRGTVDLGLPLTSRLEFGQRASLLYEVGTSSGLLTSTLDSNISDRLKIRFTYEYRMEENGSTGASSSGSISRASLVYRL